MTTLNVFMASIRRLETGSWEGDYQAVGHMGGQRSVGAYQILESHWPTLAARAGLAGADWRSKEAQDIVAGTAMAQHYERYGSWDLVASAWIGGARSADIIAARGGPNTIRSNTIKRYVTRYQQLYTEASGMDLPDVAPDVMRTPSGWVFPVAGENNWKAGGFLYKRSAGAVAKGKTRIHEGIDIGAKKGTPVVSPITGKVIGSGYSDKGGNWAKIRGDDGIDYYFAHMDKTGVVKGQQISAGHTIGTVGNSGNAKGTSPHLHFTMRQVSNRALVNPSSYLGGATVGGGSAPAPTVAGVQAPQTSTRSMMTGFFDSMSQAMAGEDGRQDYREIELQPPEPQVVADDPIAASIDKQVR